MTPPDPTWRVVTSSVRGRSHALHDRPNQDAFGAIQTAAGDLPVIAAVADGHGDALYFRSGVGAELAVSAALEALQQVVASGSRAPDARIARAVVGAWRRKVSAHMASVPFKEDEIRRALAQTRGPPADFSDDPFLAYGSTVVAAILTAPWSYYFQVGDGDILVVDPSGRTSRQFPPAEDYDGDATLSLCLPNAELGAQTRWLDHTACPTPEMILLCTDGYAKSFKSEADFLQLGPDYVALFQRLGVEGVAQELPRYLSYATENGSGDDITVAIVTRDPAKAPASASASASASGVNETEVRSRASGRAPGRASPRDGLDT